MHQGAIAEARRRGYGEKVKRGKTGRFIPPAGFEESPFPQSLPMGAQAVYREDRRTDSVQIRVFEDYVTYQLDRYHPKYHPIQHAVADATVYTAAALIVIGAAGAIGG